MQLGSLAVAGFVLAAGCNSPTPTSIPDKAAPAPPAVKAAPATPRWFAEARTYENGPALSAAAPTISLCTDGRYVTQEAYAWVPSGQKPVDLSKSGMACCREGEGGTYQLRWSASGVLLTIHLTSAKGVERDLTVDPNGNVAGSAPRVDRRFCSAPPAAP